MKRRNLIVFALCLLLSIAVGTRSALAETPNHGKAENEFRYEFKVIDSKLYRLDKFSGAIDLVTLPAKDKSDSALGEHNDVKNLAEMKTSPRLTLPPKEARNHKPIITGPHELFLGDDGAVNDDPGYVPETITGAYREHARGEIAQHSDEFGVSLTVSGSGNQLSGMMTVSYKGRRRILAMEISLFVPVVGDKNETVRYVLGDRKGQEAPPGPNKSRTAFFKVDQKFDAVIRGQIEHKITYVKFAEE